MKRRYRSPNAVLLERDRLRPLRPYAFPLWAAAVVGWVLTRWGAPFLIPGAVIAAVLFAVFARTGMAQRPAAPRGVEVDDEGLHAGGKLVARRSAIRQGFVLFHGAWRVRLEMGRGRAPFEIDVPDEKEGRSILSRLGLDVTQSTAEVMARSPYRSLRTVTFAAVAFTILATVTKQLGLALYGGVDLLAWIVLPTLCVYAALGLPPLRVLIGLDEIVTRFWGFEKRYPFAQIERVRLYEGEAKQQKGHLLMRRVEGVELVLHGGKTVRIAMGSLSTSATESALLCDRIEQALATFRAGDSSDLGVLARGSRAYGAWIESLRAMGSGAAAGFRNASVPPERLVRVALDASAPPVARVSAAVALGPVIDPADRVRIREAASATVSPKLRIALERAVADDTDDAALEEALTELEAESEERAD